MGLFDAFLKKKKDLEDLTKQAAEIEAAIDETERLLKEDLQRRMRDEFEKFLHFEGERVLAELDALERTAAGGGGGAAPGAGPEGDAAGGEEKAPARGDALPASSVEIPASGKEASESASGRRKKARREEKDPAAPRREELTELLWRLWMRDGGCSVCRSQVNLRLRGRDAGTAEPDPAPDRAGDAYHLVCSECRP